MKYLWNEVKYCEAQDFNCKVFVSYMPERKRNTVIKYFVFKW